MFFNPNKISMKGQSEAWSYLKNFNLSILNVSH